MNPKKPPSLMTTHAPFPSPFDSTHEILFRQTNGALLLLHLYRPRPYTIMEKETGLSASLIAVGTSSPARERWLIKVLVISLPEREEICHVTASLRCLSPPPPPLLSSPLSIPLILLPARYSLFLVFLYSTLPPLYPIFHSFLPLISI